METKKTKTPKQQKTAVENIIGTLKGKKVLFLENDNGLYHGLDEMEELFIEHKIDFKCLFEVNELPFEKILSEIKDCDAIVFQTQWVYEVSKKIRDFMYESTDKKIVIECYLGNDPTWYYKPDAVHDVFICKPPTFKAWDEWKFFKLSKKPYWDYKNKFNK